ncbi:hypothetical protein KFL_002490020 [Klebsormidium nitens]|uniref:5'-3' exonuclease domain-containing protein n=1 Tax=Klebsormidium nitens TaxID=105231 RepID=A0A1Y1I419_KLENI|nr:hypothetical protein KFL_002490020 [Klebsormidium nitens]|eukprot:GAQ85684.1 hypothetical protein KFL_002490020 [Klebsormidium nitens]
MPICYRGRGRGKLDPRACLEWMEALIGISGDSPIIGVLDGDNGNAWRRELYPDYKSGRKLYHPWPTIGHRRNRHRVHIDPFENMPMLEPLFRLLNIPIVKVPHAEADDVIATLAQQAVDMGHRVNIVSPDTDLRQLLNERISIWAPRAELMREFNFFDGRKFEERVGYPPEKFVLLRCLLGDQSDAIRGLPFYVPEFGRNSAIKLIEKFGSVAELLEAARMRTIGRPYMQDAVLEYSQVLELNERLITLRRDVEGVTLDPSWLQRRDRSTERDAYNACKYGVRVMKREGRTVLVRPSPDADRKLSGVPIPPKKPRPPKDRAPRWPPGFQDYKGLLQTACVRARCPIPEYSLETEGLVHEPLHSATVSVGGLAVKGPYEKLKKSAEHGAARAAWEALLRDQNGTEDWTLEQKGEAVQRALHERVHGGTILGLLEGQLQTH